MKFLKRLEDGRIQLDFKYSYPYNPDYVFVTELERIDLDKEREHDIITGNGFIVSPTNGIKKDLKDDHSIFSSKFGNNLSDQDQFQNTFRCKCGMTTKKINLGLTCKFCGTKVENVETNPRYTGWIVIKSDDYFIIHPNLYKSIEFLIGKEELDNIINIGVMVDEDGHIHKIEQKDQPFYGIGMIEFYNRFDEILKYYVDKFQNKQNYYNNIVENRDKIFSQSIPVFSTMLRPFNEDKESFYFEESNAIYTKINKLVSELNYSKSKFSYGKYGKIKPPAQLLYDIQVELMKLYDNIVTICEGKKGTIRSLFAGRYNFTARSVIVPNHRLRIDEIKLSYHALIELLHASIINILKKTYNLSYQEAYNRWYAAKINKDPLVEKIIYSMIKQNDRGIPMLINRNPTINYGSILQVFCVGITDSYTMEIPLQILQVLAADFDGVDISRRITAYMVTCMFSQVNLSKKWVKNPIYYNVA